MTWLDDLVTASAGSPLALRNEGSRLLVGLGAEAFGARPLAVLNVGAGRLFCSLGEDMPPGLVFEVPRTWAELEPVLRRYDGSGRDLTRLVRLSLGFPGDLDALESALRANPFRAGAIEPGGDSGVGGKPASQLMATTARSRSHVVFSAYGGLVLVSLRYQPAAEVDAVRAWNDETGSAYPDDVPVDVLALLRDCRALDGAAYHRDLAPSTPPGILVASLLTLELMRAPIDEESLRALADHADAEVRRAVLSVAGQRGMAALLRERAERETDPTLRRYLDHYLEQL